MSKYPTPSVKTPYLLELYVSAIARDGICAMEIAPSPASVNRFTLTATVEDPDHRLFKVSQLAKGKHANSRSTTCGPNVTGILCPGVELSFHAGNTTGIATSTSIIMDFTDPWVLFGKLLEAGLIQVEDGSHPLTIEVVYNLFRQSIRELSGFEGLDSSIVQKKHDSGLSPLAKEMIAEIGDDISNPPRLNEILEYCHDFGHAFCRYHEVANEVLIYAVQQLGPKLDDILPFNLVGYQRSYEAVCRGCRWHDVTRNRRNYWKLEAWLDPNSPKGTWIEPSSPWTSWSSPQPLLW